MSPLNAWPCARLRWLKSPKPFVFQRTAILTSQHAHQETIREIPPRRGREEMARIYDDGFTRSADLLWSSFMPRPRSQARKVEETVLRRCKVFGDASGFQQPPWKRTVARESIPTLNVENVYLCIMCHMKHFEVSLAPWTRLSRLYSSNLKSIWKRIYIETTSYILP